MHFIYFIIIGLIAGWIAGKIMKIREGGLITNLIVGVVGAVLGGALFDLLDIQATSTLGNLVTATIGAVLLIFLLRKFGGGETKV